MSVLDNCLIEYGGGPGAMSSVVVAAPARISNCVFRNSAKPGLAIGPMLVPCIGEGNLFSGNYPEVILVTGERISADTRWDDHGVPYWSMTTCISKGHSRWPLSRLAPGPR